MKLKILSAALGGLLLLAGVAVAGGYYTNGLVSTPTPWTGNETLPLDTGLAGGAAPQSASSTVTNLHNHVPVTLAYSATETLNGSVGDLYLLTLTASATTFAAPTNLVQGKNWRLKLTQGGGGTDTVTWNTLFKWTNGVAPTLSTTAGAVDMLSFVYDGTIITGSAILNVR